MKIIVAMSGGIDSAVAAYLLRKWGNEVTGVFYKLSESPREDEKRCCDYDSVNKLSKLLSIKIETIDIHNEFQSEIVEDFLSSYKNGTTPNPCTLCNEKIKFGLGLKRAQEIIGNYPFATGHYAVIEKENNRFHLKKALDKDKDQSYMLWRLTKDSLSKIILPLGNYTKTEVRNIAKDFNMPPKRESQDICFINGTLRNFLEEHFGKAKGKVVDTKGQVLGEHSGAYLYTIGQRSGLNIPYEYPLYVVGIDVSDNIVIVGSYDECFFDRAIIKDLNVLEDWNGESIHLKGKIRYRSKESDVILKKEGEYASAEFTAPQFAVTPGQSLVLYKDDYLFAGGTIMKAFRRNPDS
ncbi:MAG: tRNA 2-thiouridine(34) synthase MnmA [Caldisericaceae bacterium]